MMKGMEIIEIVGWKRRKWSIRKSKLNELERRKSFAVIRAHMSIEKDFSQNVAVMASAEVLSLIQISKRAKI
jgi:hypothetical protein